MSETQTNLRQANAKVTVVGIVADKDLKIETNDKGENIIKGTVSVKVDDINTVRFGIYAKDKTNAGKDNPVYAGMVTVMNEYKTIANDGADMADRVRVNGDFNAFRGQKGQELINYKTSFINRIKNAENLEPKAEFDVEVYVASKYPETDNNGEETGRLVVKGWFPTYNGIDPISFVAEKDMASDADALFEIGQTIRIFGDVINSRVEKRTIIPVALGKPREKIETSYKNELVITGASDPYEEGVTENAPYDADAIKLAIQERENRIQEEAAKKSSANTGANGRPTAAGSGRTLGF